MIPQIAILGFPNVGKSTLFNRLAGRKKALVHRLPGMTRDRLSAPAVIEGRPVELIDTGGFIDVLDGAEPLARKVHEMAWEAARRADVLLFLLDGRRGLLPAEESLYLDFRKLDKPLLLAVNKIDGDRPGPETADFYRLGADRLHFISAEHKLNLDELEEALAALLPPEEAGPDVLDSRPLRIAIIGRINVGKSSLTNRLCGEERFIVSEIPGTTRDCSDVLIRRGDKSYVLVDTAGIRRLAKTADVRESAGVIRSKKAAADADVICLVLDALEFPTRQDAAVAQVAKDSGRPLVIVVNKWDLVREETVTSREVERMVFARLEFIHYASVLTVSALTGKRVTCLLDEAERVWRAGQERVSTPALNRFLQTIQNTQPPMAPGGRRFRIKYMTQTGVLPPTFRLFTGGRTSFAPAYAKFFEKRLREAFGFDGTPLRLVLRSPSFG